MYTYLEEYINELYRKRNITSPDQLDIKVISESLDIEIYYKDFVFRFKNKIILNKNNSPPKQWMSYGHELGHALWHTGNQMGMHPMYKEYQEWRADLFALHFCVPAFMLEKIELPKWKSEAIGLIARTFNVDYEFASNRLERWWGKKKFYLLDDGVQNQIKNNGGEAICIVNKSL